MIHLFYTFYISIYEKNDPVISPRGSLFFFKPVNGDLFDKGF